MSGEGAIYEVYEINSGCISNVGPCKTWMESNAANCLVGVRVFICIINSTAASIGTRHNAFRFQSEDYNQLAWPC